jgi:hypothetical protein
MIPVGTNIAFLYQGNNWDQLSDDMVMDTITNLYCKSFDVLPEDLSASQEMSERIGAVAHCEAYRNQDSIREITNEIAEKYDYIYGIALPAINNERSFAPVLAGHTPFSHVDFGRTELAETLEIQGQAVRNSWERLGDRSISVVNTSEGPIAYWEYHAGNRHRKFWASLEARMDSGMTVEAEFKAMELLKTKVTESQYRCYVLNGAFPERSTKSDLFYIFRKGLPIMVLSWHGNKEGRILACLCLHPYGYYRFTYAGVMTPTDEVISQLLLMRSDERKLWAHSGQWPAHDPRSGV